MIIENNGKRLLVDFKIVGAGCYRLCMKDPKTKANLFVIELGWRELAELERLIKPMAAATSG